MGIAALVVVAVGLGGFFLLKSEESSPLSLTAACEKAALVVAQMEKTMPSLDDVMAPARPFEEGQAMFLKMLEDGLLPSYAAVRDMYHAVAVDSSAPAAARQEAKAVKEAVDKVVPHVREIAQSVKSATSNSDLEAAADDLEASMSALNDMESPAAEAYISTNQACRSISA